MSKTVVRKCNCRHPGQDQIHGEGRRVMNLTKKGAGGKDAKPTYRCTVCNATN